MIASLLTVAAAVYIFFKFEHHRFRALYAGLACGLCFPVFTAIAYSIQLFLDNVGIDGFLNESAALVGHSLAAPFSQVFGGDVMPAAVFPGWLMLFAAIATGFRLLATAKKNQQPA